MTTSQGSLDIFPKNVANSFTNVLKTKINLNPNIDYEVGLTNLHVPAYSCFLHKNDHVNSNIQYNIGLFNFKHGRYELDRNFNKKLFSLAPGKNISGLYRESEYESTDFSNTMQDSVEELGKHVKRSHREKFMEELNASLVLEYEGQRSNYDLIQSHLAYHKAYT